MNSPCSILRVRASHQLEIYEWKLLWFRAPTFANSGTCPIFSRGDAMVSEDHRTIATKESPDIIAVIV